MTKKVFDFDLKKMPKTETSNTTCIAKKQSKTVRRFLSEYLQIQNIHSGTNLFKTKKKQKCKFLKKSRSKQQKLQQNDDTY